MIKNIIFDYGDIFINLDKIGAMQKTLELLQVSELTPEMIAVNAEYEMGLISTKVFIAFYETNFPLVSKQELVYCWNVLLKDFPLHRLAFIKEVCQQYRCFLLSNTNEMHIDWIQNDWGMDLYNEFKACFEVFYLSHEMNLRKPNADIFEFVLQKHQLNTSETLFIDDTKENTDKADELGIHTWNLNPETEDVVNLFTVKSDLFLMGALVLCVLCSSFIFVTFKLFEKYQINTLQAIIVNYAVAFVVGVYSYTNEFVITEIPQKPWFLGALILSFLFITIFNVMAITSQRNGVSVASVAGKMAIVIPVLFGVFVYHEKLTTIQIVGVIIALLAVYLATHKESTGGKSASMLFPILLFLGSGVIDTSLNIFRKTMCL